MTALALAAGMSLTACGGTAEERTRPPPPRPPPVPLPTDRLPTAPVSGTKAARRTRRPPPRPRRAAPAGRARAPRRRPSGATRTISRSRRATAPSAGPRSLRHRHPPQQERSHVRDRRLRGRQPQHDRGRGARHAARPEARLDHPEERGADVLRHLLRANDSGGTGARIKGLVVTPPDEKKSVELAWPGEGRWPSPTVRSRPSRSDRWAAPVRAATTADAPSRGVRRRPTGPPVTGRCGPCGRPRRRRGRPDPGVHSWSAAPRPSPLSAFSTTSVRADGSRGAARPGPARSCRWSGR